MYHTLANPDTHARNIQHGISRTMPQMGIVPSSLAVAVATSTTGPAVDALATSAPGPDPSSAFELLLTPLLSVFDPAMPAWLFLSSEPRFAFITMILTYLSYAIGLSNLSLNINNKKPKRCEGRRPLKGGALLAHPGGV